MGPRQVRTFDPCPHPNPLNFAALMISWVPPDRGQAKYSRLTTPAVRQ